MRRGIGQAARDSGRLLHYLLLAAEVLALAAVLAGGALAWRLAQGPLEVGWLTRRLESAVNAGGEPPQLVIGHAALAWEGFTQCVDQPLNIRLTGVAVLDADGRRIAELPRVELSLSAGWLVLGRIVPRGLELDGLRLSVWRGEDGGITVDLGDAAPDPVPAPAASGPGVPPALLPGLLPGLLVDLARPAETDRGLRRSSWSQLRRLRIRDGALTVSDRQLGAVWRASQLRLDVLRRATGGADADGELTLGLGEQTVHATAGATLAAGAASASLRARLTPVTPARLAALAPALAPLSVIDAPLALSASADISDALILSHVKLVAQLSEGRLLLGAGSMPVVGAVAEAEGSLAALDVRVPRLELAPRPDGPRTTLRASVHATRANGRLDAGITGELDQVAFADLPALWPVGVGGPGTRPWITTNMTAGIARNGRFDLHLTAPEDFSNAEVTSLSGGIEAQDVTVHWLRPVPPVEHAGGRATFLSPDEMEITITGGRQAGGTQGGVAVPSGRARISGLAAHDQFITLETDLAGPVADAWTVLRQPRLHLLDRRPVDLRDPSGTLAAQVTITRMPLKDDLPVDDVHVHTTGKLTRLHVGGIAAGRDLDQGMLDFSAGNDGLTLRGTALLAGIPAQVQADMDFRGGGAAEVLQKVSVTGTADARQLAAAGLDGAGMLNGPAELRATAQTRRDGSGEVLVRADLRQAVLAVPRLNFSKPAGRPANAELHLLLEGDRLTGIDRLRLDGDGIAVAGSVAFAGGGASILHLERVRLGATDASGDVRLPRRPGDPYVATLSGRSLDASAEFGHGNAVPKRPATEADEPGPPWSVDAHFDQVVMGGEDRVLNGVVGGGESDGRIIRRGLLTGRTGAGAGFRVEIVPGRFARTLNCTAEDAGLLLRALDLVDDMRGGRLSVQGSYDDRAPGHPLLGSAEIVDFRMHNAPGLAKLLQAMTLYGLVEVLQGPGLGFSRLIAPFRLSDDVLELADARAFSASLGMTAKGRIDFARHSLSLQGTIVPAYFFNSLLGELPLIGRLFSPERGGGLFAATYAMRGPFDDPAVTVNPLAALTPGFLRGVFGIFDGRAGAGN